MKFLHLSDTHIHAIAGNEELLKRLAFILSNYPDHKLILTGDVTDDGNEAQYVNAMRLFKSFRNRVYFLPGNHDYGKLGNFYCAEAAARFDSFGAFFGMHSFAKKSPVVYQDGDCVIILLNSNLETEDPFDFACGEIGQDQINLISAILARDDLIKIVALHHHPFIHGDPTMELKDAREFLRALHKKADLLLFGHKHEKGRWSDLFGCKLILASGAMYDESFAWEITIEDQKIYSQEVPIC